MSSKPSRSVRPVQLVALLLAFVAISILTGVLSAGLFVPMVGSAGVVVKEVPTIFEELPDDLQLVQPASESKMLDAEGHTIATFYDKRRIVVPSDKIAESMKQAIVAIEDKRFYQHHGVDADGVLRALVNNLSDSGGTQGASTITQQYVRNMLLEKGYQEGNIDQVNQATEQTAERKLREMKYALALESKVSKDDILTGYLNIAPFGPVVYGVEAASQLYFSKSASELDPNESALLAGLVQSPVQYDPLTHPDAAQKRRDTVLQVMEQQGIITEDQMNQYLAVNVSDMLKVTDQPEGCAGASNSLAYFCDYALQQFLSDDTYGKTKAERLRALNTQGLEVRTTADPTMQQAAWNSLTSALPLDNPYGGTGLNDALASVDPTTGNVKAMAQNTAYGVTTDSNPRATMYNYAADGMFQVGSTFKIFTLIEWFKEGHSAYETVGSNNRDYPSYSFTCNGQKIYTDNYHVEDLPGKDGPMGVLRATGLSVNQAFVNMATKVDFCAIFEQAKAMGITKPNGDALDYLPANIIGSGSASPLQIASVMGTLANGGIQCEPNALLSVTDRNGNTMKKYDASCKRVLDATVAAQVLTTLKLANQQYYVSEGVRLSDGREYAAKTGTTNDNSNTWTAGTVPQLATAVWMGYGTRSSTPVSDVTVAGHYIDFPYGSTVGAYIWAPYMSAALSGTPATPLNQASVGAPPRADPSENTDENEGQDQGTDQDSGGGQQQQDGGQNG